jgi:ABC-type dipeptide/oligopeptide/nickel transport system ATPase component
MCGRDIGVVFQDPIASLKPTMCVGDQIMALAVFTAVRLSISSGSHTER